jgi:hypothetical protein
MSHSILKDSICTASQYKWQPLGSMNSLYLSLPYIMRLVISSMRYSHVDDYISYSGLATPDTQWRLGHIVPIRSHFLLHFDW